MIADAKRIAADVDETIAAVKSLRARILCEDREVEDRRALARPGLHQVVDVVAHAVEDTCGQES